MTTGQINIWRADVRHATRAATLRRIPFSEVRYDIDMRVVLRVLQTSCMKLNGL